MSGLSSFLPEENQYISHNLELASYLFHILQLTIIYAPLTRFWLYKMHVRLLQIPDLPRKTLIDKFHLPK